MGPKPKLNLKFGLKLAAGLAICLLCAAFLAFKVQTFGLETGQLGSGTYSGENLAHSLDLALAAKASYPSSPLKTVEDLGITDGLKKAIVSFAVTTDHLTEYALMFAPDKPAPATGFPAIILCHGYINPADYVTTDGYISTMEFFASHGFAVIKPDFRGQGLSAEAGLPDSAYYSMAYNIDLMSLISSLKQTGFIDKNRLNLWGHSMGAYIALRASVVSKDIKTTTLLSTPGGDLPKLYLTYVPASDENNIYALKTRADVFNKYGTPAAGTDFWQAASPDNYLKGTKTVFEINVGDLDTVVPPVLSADLNNAMNTAHINHQYFVYPTGNHGLSAQHPLIMARTLQMLEANHQI